MSFFFAPRALAMVALGLVRILRGPDDADRMMAAQLLGSGGIAVLLLSAGGSSGGGGCGADPRPSRRFRLHHIVKSGNTPRQDESESEEGE